ncbi:MAG: hypothetical protein AB7O62_09635 [Pirellulales bacterium]
MRLKPGDNGVRCAQCGTKVAAPSHELRFDAAPAASVASPAWSIAHVDTAGVRATPCPLSAAEGWLLDEDLRHIGRVAAGTLRRPDDRARVLDELLLGEGPNDSIAAEPVERPVPRRSPRVAHGSRRTRPARLASLPLETYHSAPQEPEAGVEAAEGPTQSMSPQAPEIKLRPLAGELQAARQPSKLAIALGHAASALGALALINGLGLVVWSKFGGPKDLASFGLPICLTGVGLLFVSHLVQAGDEGTPPAPQAD